VNSTRRWFETIPPPPTSACPASGRLDLGQGATE
jgi:hypothetical protein